MSSARESFVGSKHKQGEGKLLAESEFRHERERKQKKLTVRIRERKDSDSDSRYDDREFDPSES
jgi:hypothetical protein